MPLWRFGRAHLTFPGRGTRNLYPGGSRSRRDLEFGAEWRFLVLADNKIGPFGFGWTFKWGTNGSETSPDFSVHLWRLGDLWLKSAHALPYRWLERHKPNGDVDYNTREFGFTIDSRGFRWDCWAPSMSWTRGQPWWWHQSFEWRALFFGRDHVETIEVDSGVCVVPMPEANYPAEWQRTRYEHHNTKRLGRLRDSVLGIRTHELVTVEPGKPVPVPGKGENSWDCGDDAIHALSAPGSVEEVIGHLVADALRTRKRYGGMDMSVPKGEARA